MGVTNIREFYFYCLLLKIELLEILVVDLDTVFCILQVSSFYLSSNKTFQNYNKTITARENMRQESYHERKIQKNYKIFTSSKKKKET